MSEKLVILGYDGVPFNLLYELVQLNKLPNFKKLIRTGSYGVLSSTLPPISPVAWPSLLSGENPGKHGIFSFFEYDAGLLRTNTSINIHGKTFFDILSHANKKIIAVNIPCTYPAWDVNGILIPGFPIPGNKVQSFPADIINDVEDKIGKYYVDLPSEGLHKKGLTEKKFLQEINSVTEKRTDAIIYLMENYEWDFFMGVYIGTDRILHAYFGNHDINNNLYDEEKSKIIVNYFQELDEYLGKILSTIDNNTTVMIVSDHGFEPFNKIIGINNVLVKAGLIDRKISFKGKFKKRFLKLLKKIDADVLVKMEKVSKKLNLKDPLGLSRSSEFENSIAISIHVQGISINKNNLSGYIYEELKKKIVDLALSIKDPETDESIIERVFDKKELYAGDNIAKAPDLLLIPKKGYAVGTWISDEPKPVKEVFTGIPQTGTHAGFDAQQGILILNGEDVRQNFRSDASIIDIAPTILHFYNLPVTNNMDGQVLKNIFTPSSKFVQNQVRLKKLEEMSELGDISDDEPTLSDEEEDLIIRRLKKLGYIS